MAAKAESFSWDEVYARRREMAAEVRAKLGVSFGFKVEEPFHARDLVDQLLADQQMWHVPFYVVGHRMRELGEHGHVIDHAWWLIADASGGEPWGFVTEPYMDERRSQAAARLVTREHRGWGIEAWALPKARSAWLPGSTVAIVVIVRPGCLSELLRHGVGAALRALRHVEV